MMETFCFINPPGEKYSLVIHLSAVLHIPRSEQLHASLFHAGLGACRGILSGKLHSRFSDWLFNPETREKKTSVAISGGSCQCPLLMKVLTLPLLCEYVYLGKEQSHIPAVKSLIPRQKGFLV